MRAAAVNERRLSALFGRGRLSTSDSTSSDEAPEPHDQCPALQRRGPGCAARPTCGEQDSSGDESTMAALRPRWAEPRQVQRTAQGDSASAGRLTEAAHLPRWAARHCSTTSSSEGSGSSAITAAPCGTEASVQRTPPWLRWARRCALSSSDSSAGTTPAASPSPAAGTTALPAWASPPWQPQAQASLSDTPALPQRSMPHSSPQPHRGPCRSLTNELERAARGVTAAPAQPPAPSSPAVVAVLPLLVPPELSARFNLVPAGPAGCQPTGAEGSPGAVTLDSWLIPAVAAALSQPASPASASPGRKAHLLLMAGTAGSGSSPEPAPHGGIAEPSFSFQLCPSLAALQEVKVSSSSRTEAVAAAVGPKSRARPPSLWSRVFCQSASAVKA